MARKPRKSVKEDCRVTIGVRLWEGPAPWARLQSPIMGCGKYLATVVGQAQQLACEVAA